MRLIFLAIGLFVVLASLDRLLAIGEHGNLFATAAALIFIAPAILLFGTKVTYADDVLTQRLLWHKTSVRVSQLKRVEYYTQPVLGVNHILRLEDDKGTVLRVIISNYSSANVALLAETIQESLTASGIKTNFIVLGSLKHR